MTSSPVQSDIRTVKLFSNDVLTFCYTTVDLHYLILPRTKGNQIIGWVLYDSEAGQLYREKPSDERRVWDRANKVKLWLNDHHHERK